MSTRAGFIVKYLMDTQVISIREETTLEEMLILIRRYNIGDFPVVDADGKYRGMVYERDLVLSLYPDAEEMRHSVADLDLDEAASRARNKIVKQIMTRDVLEVSGEDHVMNVATNMVSNKLPRVPVLKDGKVVGVLSQNKIFTEIMGRATDKVPAVDHLEVQEKPEEKPEPPKEDLGQRLFHRVELTMMVAYKPTIGHGEEDKASKGKLAQAVNISAGGMLIQTDEVLERGALVDIAFDLYHTNQPIKRLFRVVRCDSAKEEGSYDIGLMLLAISADEQQKIDEYLMKTRKY